MILLQLLKLKELCIYWNCLLMPKQLLKDKIGDGSKDWKVATIYQFTKV